MKQFLLGLFLVLTALYFYYGRSQSDSFTGEEMNFPYTVQIDSKMTSNERKKALEIIKNAFSVANAQFNKDNKNSEISKINRLPANTAVPIPEELERLLLLADRVHILTKGLFDPTNGHWKNIRFKGRVFYKDDSSIQIDLGGILKGYTVDILTQNLHDEGFQRVYVEWGGKMKALGDWTVPVDEIALSNMALAITADVVVKLSSCGLADGIATALTESQSREELGQAIKKELGEGEFWFLEASR